MKSYEVIVERDNGHFRAMIPTLPNVTVEGATCDEAIVNVKAAAERYLSRVEVATVEIAECSVPQRQSGAFEDDQAEERAELITVLEQMEPQTELGAQLISLRLQMLRDGQRLRSLDEINRDLEREVYADVS